MAKKLYMLAPTSFRLPLFTEANSQLKTRKADGIPFVHWPDGSWCLPANLYMQELYRRGLSTKNGGGTLATYAAGLTHLIRFCWSTRTDPRELSNDDFARFIKHLSDELCPRHPGQKARSANRVIDIGRVCLDRSDATGDQVRTRPPRAGFCNYGHVLLTARGLQARASRARSNGGRG